MGAAVLVPASSANLGPGFDSFGLALDLHNRFEAELSHDWKVTIEGDSADSLSTGPDNAAARAMVAAFAEAGRSELRASLRCVTSVPSGSGLGSSSTAIVGGLLLGEALAGARFSDVRRLEIAARLEGHPDNVAAALFGGFTICWSEEGTVRHARFEPARGLAVVAVPATASLSTAETREMLPQAVPHADAAFNVAHAGLLAAALAAGRPELLGAALSDKLHEPYRASAVADLHEVGEILVAAGASGVALSGAGPTVIGLVAGQTDEAAYDLAREVAGRCVQAVLQLGSRRSPMALRIDRRGARLL